MWFSTDKWTISRIKFQFNIKQSKICRVVWVVCIIERRFAYIISKSSLSSKCSGGAMDLSRTQFEKSSVHWRYFIPYIIWILKWILFIKWHIYSLEWSGEFRAPRGWSWAKYSSQQIPANTNNKTLNICLHLTQSIVSTFHFIECGHAQMDHVTNTSIQHTDLSDDVMTKYLIWCLVWWKPKSSYEIQMEHKILKTKKTFQFKMIVARNKQSNKIHSY